MTPAQEKALYLAEEHGHVMVGHGFGRDTLRPNAVAASTWRYLVFGGLLTPHVNGERWTGPALRVERGRLAYLTTLGRLALRALRDAVEKEIGA